MLLICLDASGILIRLSLHFAEFHLKVILHFFNDLFSVVVEFGRREIGRELGV